MLTAHDQRDRRAQRRRGEHGVLERAKREHSRNRTVAVLAGAPKRPVVDCEAAARSRRREHAETPDYRADGIADGQLRPLVDLGCVAHGQHVAEVRHELAAEAEHEPGRVEVVSRAGDPPRAGEIGQPGDRAER